MESDDRVTDAKEATHPRYPSNPPLGSHLYVCTWLGHFVSGEDEFCACCLSTKQERVAQGSAGLAEPAPLATYTLTLHGPPVGSEEWHEMGGQLAPALLSETEENLTDLLPDGYSVKIERWDAP